MMGVVVNGTVHMYDFDTKYHIPITQLECDASGARQRKTPFWPCTKAERHPFMQMALAPLDAMANDWGTPCVSAPHVRSGVCPMSTERMTSGDPQSVMTLAAGTPT